MKDPPKPDPCKELVRNCVTCRFSWRNGWCGGKRQTACGPRGMNLRYKEWKPRLLLVGTELFNLFKDAQKFIDDSRGDHAFMLAYEMDEEIRRVEGDRTP